MTRRASRWQRDKVCVNGDLGSGKTTAARRLAKLLGYEFYSIGLIQRQIAQRLGITTLELNKRSETDRTVDDQVDAGLKALASDPRKIVIDSRMGWFFIPHSLKIRLVCHPLTSATRLLNDRSRSAEKYQDIEQAIAHVAERRASERKRFLALYNVSVEYLPDYHLVIQTDLCSRKRVVDLVTTHMNVLRHNSNRLILSPRLVFPLDPVRGLAQQITRNGAPGAPIDVIYHDDCFFVVDGHKRLAAALGARADSIVAQLQSVQLLPTGTDPSEYVRGETSLARIYDWEAAFKFRFPFYPGHLK